MTHPAGYWLNYREQNNRGGIRNPAEHNSPKPSAIYKRTLLLLHGFNNNRAEAEAAYGRFTGWAVRTSNPLPQSMPGGVCAVYWPGDGWTPLFYPDAVGVAKALAPILARDLGSLPVGATSEAKLDIIGHSLGCRVALEVVNLLVASGSAGRIGKVCLMAAAVPTFMLGPGGRLRDAINVLGEKLMVLHSTSDWVLDVAFPTGQGLAGEDEGKRPEALGRHGNIPSAPMSGFERRIPWAGHSAYWGEDFDSESESGLAVMDQLSRSLYLGDHPKARVPSRREPTSSRRVAER